MQASKKILQQLILFIKPLLWQGKMPNLLFIVGVIFLGIGALVAGIGAMLEFGYLDWNRIIIVFYANISSEIASIAITILIIDNLNKYRILHEEKKELVLQLGSPTQVIAVEAARILQARKWIHDPILNQAALNGANLTGARLENANLVKADMEEAILIETFFVKANLQGAKLYRANLQGARLTNANLINADLRKANLSGVQIRGANLRGADLREAILEGITHLNSAKFNEKTLLPDGKHWQSGIDVETYAKIKS